MINKEAFKAWWYSEGSQPPYTHHDCEEHTMRMCEIAWANGAYKEREACAKVCDAAFEKAMREQSGTADDLANIFLRHHAVAHQDDATAIRARGQV